METLLNLLSNASIFELVVAAVQLLCIPIAICTSWLALRGDETRFVVRLATVQAVAMAQLYSKKWMLAYFALCLGFLWLLDWPVAFLTTALVGMVSYLIHIPVGNVLWERARRNAYLDGLIAAVNGRPLGCELATATPVEFRDQ